MAASFVSESKTDKVRIVIHLVLTYLLTVAITCYAYIPFRREEIFPANGESPIPNGNTTSSLVVFGRRVQGGDSEIYMFKVAVYGGFAMGSLLSGVASYTWSPKVVSSMSCKLLILSSMLGAFVIDDGLAMPHIIWFLLGFNAFASYTSVFIYTLESVPGNWVVCVGLGILGLGWSTARLYSILLVTLVDDCKSRLFWNSFALFCILTAQDILKPKSEAVPGAKNESFKELMRNPYGRRYFACLAILWMVSGYVFYGISHHIYKDTMRAQAFVFVTDGAGNLLALFLCLHTRQKKTVIGALLMLNAACCFALSVLEVDHAEGSMVSTLAQICSFLVTCHWNILWILTIEIIGRGTRYVRMPQYSLTNKEALSIGKPTPNFM